MPAPTSTTATLVTLVALAAGVLLVSGCQTPASSSAGATAEGPLRALQRPIDLDRFMGDWFVLAHIPVFIERDAHNAVESYELTPDGTIATTYTFNRGTLDGPVRTLHPKGWVHDQVHRTEWRMQFVWPFKSAYLIVYVDDEYETTVIGVPGRKYAWIMARSPSIPEERYEKLVEVLRATGHDVSRLRRVPHG
jgi:apolipoprotein D and lipocalin family protein